MTSRSRSSGAPPRRGFALLLALVALVLVMTALGGALGALSTAQRAIAVDGEQARLDDALDTGERIALAWIARTSQHLVLPPEGGGVLLANDALVTSTGTTRFSVTIYDGLGGIPGRFTQLGDPLRFALPDAFSGISVPRQPSPAAGAPTDLIERISIPDGVPRFPQTRGDPPRLWLDGGDLQPSLGTDLRADPAPSLAELVSVHSDGRINLNTAPAALVREAYQVFGLGDADALLELRAKGTFVSAPQTTVVDSEPGLKLVTSSDTWEVLISVSRAGAEHRWWVVIAGIPPEVHIVQRHDADG